MENLNSLRFWYVCNLVIFINILIIFHILNTEQIKNSFKSLGGKITS